MSASAHLACTASSSHVPEVPVGEGSGRLPSLRHTVIVFNVGVLGRMKRHKYVLRKKEQVIGTEEETIEFFDLGLVNVTQLLL